jgi:hypothetical protein
MSSPPAAPVFYWRDLEQYDPHARRSDTERRFCCPLCGDGKPRDGAHRCLAVNVQTGAWKCHRCGAVGKLCDFWQASDEWPDRANFRKAAQRSALRAFEVPQKGAAMTATAAQGRWRADWEQSAPLESTAGASYLERRGIPCKVAHAAGVRFASSWFGRAAVVFPLCDRAGTLIAAQGRFLTTQGSKPKAITSGPKSGSIFATSGAFADVQRGAPLVLTEAPIDALSIAVTGFPAFAFCGTSAPTWLHLIGGRRRVLLATDADEVGDRAADIIGAALSVYGAECERLRPDGVKDWNEFITRHGVNTLRDFLAVPILSGG